MKSTIADILAAMTAVNALDKHGKLTILRELQRQNLVELEIDLDKIEQRKREKEEKE